MSCTADRLSARGSATHEVLNQAPPFEDYNAFDADPAVFGETADEKTPRLTDSQVVGDGVAILIYGRAG